MNTPDQPANAAIFAEAERMCREMVPVISGGMGDLPFAENEEQAFRFLWAQHLAQAPAAERFFQAWLSGETGEMTLEPEARRQVHLRLTSAIHALAGFREGQTAIGGAALQSNPTPEGAVRLLAVLLWRDGDYPKDWLRQCARVQIEQQ